MHNQVKVDIHLNVADKWVAFIQAFLNAHKITSQFLSKQLAKSFCMRLTINNQGINSCEKRAEAEDCLNAIWNLTDFITKEITTFDNEVVYKARKQQQSSWWCKRIQIKKTRKRTQVCREWSNHLKFDTHRDSVHLSHFQKRKISIMKSHAMSETWVQLLQWSLMMLKSILTCFCLMRKTKSQTVSRTTINYATVWQKTVSEVAWQMHWACQSWCHWRLHALCCQSLFVVFYLIVRLIDIDEKVIHDALCKIQLVNLSVNMKKCTASQQWCFC